MASCGEIVKRIEYDPEGLKPRDVELGIHNVAMVGLKFGVWSELLRNFLCNLESRMSITPFQIHYSRSYVVLQMRDAEGEFVRERRQRAGMVGSTYQGL